MNSQSSEAASGEAQASKGVEPCRWCGKVHRDQERMDEVYSTDAEFREFSDRMDAVLDELCRIADFSYERRGVPRHESLFDLVMPRGDPIRFWGILNAHYQRMVIQGRLAPAPGDEADKWHADWVAGRFAPDDEDDDAPVVGEDDDD